MQASPGLNWTILIFHVLGSSPGAKVNCSVINLPELLFGGVVSLPKPSLSKASLAVPVDALPVPTPIGMYTVMKS